MQTERLNINSNVVCRGLRALVLFLLGSMMGCSTWQDEIIDPDLNGGQSAAYNIAILAGSSPSSRVEIDQDDLQSVNWHEDDQIALWALAEGASTFTFAATPLELYYYGAEYSSAIFTGNVDAMESGTYSYFAAYPLPTSTSGNNATFNIPSSQSGYYDGVADVMLASVEGDALGDNAFANESLEFRHLMHAIRVEIPQDRDLLGSTMKLQITFPEDVVGDATFDVTSGELVSLSNASNSIYVDFDQVISDAGYVWVFINPTTIDGDIEFVGYDNDDIPSQAITTTLSNRYMAAGSITPLTLTIPTETYRSVVLSLTENNLGEPITSATLTAPSGAYFDNDLSEITVEANDDGDFKFSYSPKLYDAAFRSGDITVVYESDNAIVPGNPITLTDDDKYLVNYTYDVIPYLFEEDFSGVSTTGSYAGTDEETTVLDNVLPGLSYWQGAIYSYWEGSSVAVRTYYCWWANNGTLILNLDGLTYLKEGKSVTLLIEFYADWKENKFSTMYLNVYNSSDSESIKMSSNSNASSSKITTKCTVELSGCTSTSEIKWATDASSGSGFTWGYDYIYMDNIKISIKK